MASRKVKISVAKVAKMRDAGKTWDEIADKLGVSKSTLARVVDEGEDREVILRSKPKAKAKPKLKAVNQALEDSAKMQDALQAKLSSLLSEMRRQRAATANIDAASGVCVLTYAQTVKIGGDDA